MGRRRQQPTLPADVRRVQARIERWRRTRTKRSPMPEALWRAAAELARAHGVSRIARALRVGYGSLKSRVGGGGDAPSSGFIEVTSALRPAVPSFVEVELVSADGSKLTIRLPSSSGLDVPGLVGRFWERHR